MPPARLASVRAIAEAVLGVWLLVSLSGCPGDGPGAATGDVPGAGDDGEPVQCATPLDCPDRECLVVAGCVAGQCRYTPVFSPGQPIPCTPRSPCYGSATCDHEGRCVTDPESRKACDDDNPCTDDSCDDRTGSCVRVFRNETPCDDGNACTEDDTCVQGVCQGGRLSCPCLTDLDCPVPGDRCAARFRCVQNACVPDPKTEVRCPASANPCQVLRCDPADGTCRPEAVDDSLLCDDGDPCTEGDACLGGTCQGTLRSCDDGDPCTGDLCDPSDGTCGHPGLTGPSCDDRDPCTAGETCSGGLCGGGTPVPGCCHQDGECGNGDPCMAGSCDPGTHRCVFAPVTPCCGNGQVEAGEECDDGNPDDGDGCSRRCEFLEFEVAGSQPPLTSPTRAAVALSEDHDRFLVVFHNWHPTLTSGSGIWGRLVGLDGQFLSEPFRIEGNLSLTLRWPAVTSIGDRGFLVAWRDAGVTRFRRVDAEGFPVGPERTLATEALRDVPIDDALASQELRVVALHAFRPAGSRERVALLAWMQDESPENQPQGGNHRIHYAILQENPEGSWIPLEGYPRPLASANASFWKVNPQVVSDQAGNFLLLWTARDPANPRHWEQRAALVRPDGSVLREILVREYPDSGTIPSVSGVHIPPLGMFATTSPVTRPEEGLSEVRANLYTTALDPLDTGRMVFVERSPSLAFFTFPAGADSFATAFASVVDLGDIDLKIQRLTTGLMTQGTAIRLHGPSPAYRYGIEIAPHPRGGLFAVWVVHESGAFSVRGRMFGPVR